MRVPDPFAPPLTTDMDSGIPRSRRSTTINVAGLQFVIKMENAEFDRFKLWVRDGLVDGTLPFEMPIWTGSVYASRTCRFRQPRPYSDDPLGGIRHHVTVLIDVEDY